MNKLLDYTLQRAPVALFDAEGIVSWAAPRSMEVTAAIAAGKDVQGNDLPTPYFQSGVGIIPVVGPLMKSPSKVELAFGFSSYTGLADSIANMAQTTGTKGIILFMDSPGGDVAGIYEAAAAIEAAAGRVRVEAVVDGLCCSAALWLASKTSRITASKSSQIGSVGVVVSHISVARMLKERGLDVTVISDPGGKTAAHPYRTLDEAGTKVLQDRVAEIAGEFRSAVTAGRPGLKAEALSGLTFSANRARTLGLVDVVGETLNDVIRRLSSGSTSAAVATSPAGRNAMARAEFEQLNNAAKSAFCVAGGRIF